MSFAGKHTMSYARGTVIPLHELFSTSVKGLVLEAGVYTCPCGCVHVSGCVDGMMDFLQVYFCVYVYLCMCTRVYLATTSSALFTYLRFFLCGYPWVQAMASQGLYPA